MKKIAIIMCLAITTIVASCKKNNTTHMESHKVLVAYFSHAGDNYAVGNIEKATPK
jgi:hypothetical protein